MKYSLSFDNMAKAIGAFERTLLTPGAPFDLYVQGKGAISKAAKRGMQKVAEVGCTACHSGPLFTNNSYQQFMYGTDDGRKSVTGNADDDHFFRVQSWRNVADIVAFLETLTGQAPQVTYPVFPRPAGHALNWKD